MKRFFFVMLCAVVLAALCGAFAGESGSASDPLVTRSFLENGYGWKIIPLAAGEKLSFDLGSEAILRSGKAVVAGAQKGGITDLTLGQDLSDRTYVPANHYLISASGDGRGIKALTTCVFLTRGISR